MIHFRKIKGILHYRGNIFNYLKNSQSHNTLFRVFLSRIDSLSRNMCFEHLYEG